LVELHVLIERKERKEEKVYNKHLTMLNGGTRSMSLLSLGGSNGDGNNDEGKSQIKKKDHLANVAFKEFTRASQMSLRGHAGGLPLAMVTFEQMESFLRDIFSSADFGQTHTDDKSDDDSDEDSDNES
jgi:hypothetical protein